MEIKDIKFMNNEVFLLKNAGITLEQCIDQIRDIKYDAYYDPYRYEKDDTVENTQFPPIIFAFYSFVFYKQKIPTPEELVKNYFSINEKEIAVFNDGIIFRGREYKKDALIARVLRTYPSLIRDFHFYLLLVRENCFDKVIYSCKTDIEGKDIIVKHKGKEYQISLFVKTRRSNFFKQIKNKFRHKYSGEIQIPLDLDRIEKTGDFFLYSEQHIDTLKKHIY